MGEFSSIRGVVFDLDDTLWPCEPTIVNAENALYEWLQSNYPKITQKYSIQDLTAYRAEFAGSNPHLAHDFTALRRESMALLAKEFNYPEAMADIGLAWFRKHRNMVELYPDSLPTISRLSKHYQTGVITNGNADVDAIGLSEYFDFVVTAETAGVAKPNKGIFEFASTQSGLATHELLYVGDHPSFDIVGAKYSGWKAIWFNPGKQIWSESTASPDAEIQNICELIGLLSIKQMS